MVPTQSTHVQNLIDMALSSRHGEAIEFLYWSACPRHGHGCIQERMDSEEWGHNQSVFCIIFGSGNEISLEQHPWMAYKCWGEFIYL